MNKFYYNSSLLALIIMRPYFKGLKLLNLGVLGIYLKKLFNQINGRSKYVIKEIFN